MPRQWKRKKINRKKHVAFTKLKINSILIFGFPLSVIFVFKLRTCKSEMNRVMLCYVMLCLCCEIESKSLEYSIFLLSFQVALNFISVQIMGVDLFSKSHQAGAIENTTGGFSS